MSKYNRSNHRVKRLPTTLTDKHGCSCTQCHFFIDIINNGNLGAVAIGPDIVVNMNNQRCCHVKRKEDYDMFEAGESLRRKPSDRKRSKRLHRNDSRSNTPSPDEEIRDATLNELTLGDEGSSLQQALEIFRCCISPLHPLRDNGCWCEFESAAAKLLDESAGDLTCKIIICLEKSVVLSIKKELDRSEEMINSAVEEISQTSGSVRLLLEVLSKCYLAGLNRKRRMLGKAEECLETAKKVASGFPPCLAVAILLYEEGSWHRDFASLLAGSRNEHVIAKAKEKTKELMQRCIDLCWRLDFEQIYVRKQHFAVCKMAMLDLRCETSASRRKSIPPKSIQEARKSLETLHTDNYSKKEVQGAKIQRLIAKVDFSYRLENYDEAEELAQEALNIARKLEFNLDVMPVEERLVDIRQKITSATSTSETFRYIPGIIDSFSGSMSSKNNTPNSSEHEGKL